MKTLRNVLILCGVFLVIVAMAYVAVGGVKEPEARVLFVGDMLFDRYIRQVIETRGGDFIFSCIDELLQNADVVVGNLEGPITSAPSVSAGSAIGSPENFRFTFPPATAALLQKHNISIVTIGNNHVGNFGREGIESTKRYLAGAGVGHFGAGAVYRTKIRRVPLSFINYNEFGGEGPEEVIKTISAERAAGRVAIVYAHWGEEYTAVPERVRRAAALFAHAGASAILGSHPHVVLGSERLGDTLVYWSLGNFIFDQYWDSSVSRGLAVLLTISKDGVEVQEYPVEMKRDGRTCLL